MTIVWGILCLSVLVFIHEAGHFFAARFFGVAVESFSIGMGPVLLHKTLHGTDYRLSLIPLGGYCGMKGEKEGYVKKTVKTASLSASASPAIESEPPSFDADSFYGVHPLKRAAIAFAGPFSNLVFAIIAFMIIAMAGYTYYSANNKIILADELYPDMITAARDAGLQTGDKILSVGGKPTETFSDIARMVAVSPDELLMLEVERNGERLTMPIRPAFDDKSASGKIGIASWIDPVIAAVESGSPADTAGLQIGDVIIGVNGESIANVEFLAKKISALSKPAENVEIMIAFQRQMSDGNNLTFQHALVLPETQPPALGMTFVAPAHQAKTYSFFPAFRQGIFETGEIVRLTGKSLKILFRGADVTKAISGPARITVMLGDTVKDGFSAGLHAGTVSVLNFLALISVSLCLMNLLPIPILDGGLILFAVIEFFARRPLNQKVVQCVQYIGWAFIALIFVTAMFGDIKYFITG